MEYSGSLFGVRTGPNLTVLRLVSDSTATRNCSRRKPLNRATSSHVATFAPEGTDHRVGAAVLLEPVEEIESTKQIKYQNGSDMRHFLSCVHTHPLYPQVADDHLGYLLRWASLLNGGMRTLALGALRPIRSLVHRGQRTVGDSGKNSRVYRALWTYAGEAVLRVSEPIVG